MTVFAEDDLGGLYISNFGGDRGRPGYEDLKLTMRPRAPAGGSSFVGKREPLRYAVTRFLRVKVLACPVFRRIPPVTGFWAALTKSPA
jgi:hypothetical protein